jgi:hypothetical protein
MSKLIPDRPMPPGPPPPSPPPGSPEPPPIPKVNPDGGQSDSRKVRAEQ